MRESTRGIEKRSYQRQAVNNVCLATKTPGIYRVILVMPTGAGKTHTAMMYVSRARAAGVENILFVVHRDELREQVRKYDPDLIVETIQTLVSRETFPDVGLVIVDEAHHYSSDVWSKLFLAYPETKMLGLTATPVRGDGKPLGSKGLWQRMVVGATYPDLVKAGFLVNCKVVRPESYLGSNLGQDPVKAYLEHTPGEQGFVYTRYVADAEKLKSQFELEGVTSEVIHGDLPTDERRARVQRFKDGKTTLLVNVHCLTEGVDVPQASVCILARGCGHPSTYLQMTGRILRPHASKSHATLIDLPGVSHLHGLPLIARDYSLEGGIQQAGEKSVGVKDCPQCGNAMHPVVRTCDQCGFRFEIEARWKPRIYSLALESCWAGDETPDDAKKAEYQRLRAFAKSKGWSIGWIVKEYKRVFGEKPSLHDVTPSERMAEYQRLLALAKKKGNKPGWASWLFRETFGAWPPRASTRTQRTA